MNPRSNLPALALLSVAVFFSPSLSMAAVLTVAPGRTCAAISDAVDAAADNDVVQVGDDSTACPRTVGYWKNNVKKVLIEGRTNGVQESREALEWALDNVALSSKIFQTGIDVTAPVEMSNFTRLTDIEANAILQKVNGNSILDMALQQNLASWLNLASGKVDGDSWVTLDVAGGHFEGTLIQALREAEDIILNGGNLERAKDIGDQINKGLLD